MSKSIVAVMTAALIAGALTLLSAASDHPDSSPAAKPAEVALMACADEPWPYLNCVGTPHGNPRIRLLTTGRSTPQDQHISVQR